MTINKNNPLNLSIGDKVISTAKSVVSYDHEGLKGHERYSVGVHRPCFVVGIKRRALGKYIKGRGAWDDYEQASMKVSKYILFYECRERINSPIFLVHPDDILCTSPAAPTAE